MAQKSVDQMSLDEIEKELLSAKTGGRLKLSDNSMNEVEQFLLGSKLERQSTAVSTEVTPNAVAEVSQPAAPKKPVEQMSLEEIEQELGFRPEAPTYANGSSVDTAIKESPLDGNQRFSLFTLGNKRGQLDQLKTMFPEGVELDKSGNFKVKKNNLWYEIDPNTTEDASGWEFTRGILKGGAAALAGTAIAVPDLAEKALNGVMGLAGSNKRFDVIPDPQAVVNYITSGDVVAKEFTNEVAENVDTAAMLAIPGGQAAWTAKGVAQIAGVAGGAKLASSTLGRLEGTYSGDTTDQIIDASTDMLFSVLGTRIATGVKPTAKWIRESGAVQKMSETLKKMPQPMKDTFVGGYESLVNVARSAREGAKGFYANWQGLSKHHLDDIADIPNTVNKYLGRVSDNKLEDVQAKVYQELGEELTGTVQKLRGDVWNKGMNSVRKELKNPFALDTKEVTQSTFDWFKGKGFLQLKDGVDVERIAKMQADGLDTSRFYTFSSPDKIKTLLAQSRGGIKAAFTEDASIKQLSNLFDDIQRVRRGDLRGFRDTYDVISSIRKRTEDMRVQAINNQDSGLRGLVQQIAEAADSGFGNALSKRSPSAFREYKVMKETYGKFSDAADLITEAANSKSNTAMQELFQKLTVKSAKGSQNMSYIGELADIAKTAKSPNAPALDKLTTEIRGMQTAFELSKIADRRSLGKTQAGAVLGTAIASGNLPLAIAVGVGMASRNPMNTVRLNNVLRGVSRAKDVAQWMSMTPGGRAMSAARNDPRMMYGLTQAILDYNEAREQSKEALLNGQQDSR